MPSNPHRYEHQVEAHLTYLDRRSKIDYLNAELKQRAGGLLDDR
ncbi:hypothetical protein [Synechococcus sp. M16CYN]